MLYDKVVFFVIGSKYECFWLKEFWEQKRRQDEERDRLEAIKKKEKHEQSAVASSEVKQKLQGFLLKKQREAAANSGQLNGPSGPTCSLNSASSVAHSPPFRGWSVVHGNARPGGPPNGTSSNTTGEILVPDASNPGGQGHPYRRPLLISKYEEDFPLRKTG